MPCRNDAPRTIGVVADGRSASTMLSEKIMMNCIGKNKITRKYLHGWHFIPIFAT